MSTMDATSSDQLTAVELTGWRLFLLHLRNLPYALHRQFRRLLGKDKSPMLLFAEDELRRAGWFDEDNDYGGALGPAVLKLLKIHAKEGHSGYSSLLVADLFHHLVGFKPLTPLTGDDDEWVEVGREIGCGEPIYQNKRCPTVFKYPDGRCLDIDAVHFLDINGITYTNSKDSAREITFPYLPGKPEVVAVPPREMIPQNPEVGDTVSWNGEHWMWDGEWWNTIEAPPEDKTVETNTVEEYPQTPATATTAGDETPYEDLKAALLALIREQLNFDTGTEISPEDYLEEDLGCDSFDMVKLVLAVEERFQTEITDDEMEAILQVKDFFPFITPVTES